MKTAFRLLALAVIACGGAVALAQSTDVPRPLPAGPVEPPVAPVGPVKVPVAPAPVDVDEKASAAPALKDDVERDDAPEIAKGLVIPVYKWSHKTDAPKAVLLCLHGFPMHGATYDTFARHMGKRGFVVFAPDMRGLGRAWKSGKAPDLAYEAPTDKDLARLADRLRAAYPKLPIVVCGESMGGCFAIRLAAQHPELVDGLVVSGPGILLERHYLRLIPAGALNILGPRHKQVDFSGQIKSFFSEDPKIAKDILADPLVRTKFDVQELLQNKQMARSTRLQINRVSKDVPVLVLQGCADRMVDPDCVGVLKRYLRTKDLTTVIFQGKGHVLLETSRLDRTMLTETEKWCDRVVADWAKKNAKP